MAQTQRSLFEDEPAERMGREGLVLIASPGRPLTKAQRAFNRLVAKVEQLRAELNRTIRQYDEALAYYGEHLHARLARCRKLRKDLVRALAPFLDSKNLKQKGERQTLRTIVAGQLHDVIREGGPLEDDDLLEVFKQVHGVDFEHVQLEEMDEVRSQMKDMFGEMGIDIDLSDLQADMSEEAFAAKAAEMAETLRQRSEEVERESRGTERRKSKRQLERESRLKQADEFRKKSIASIYKQLARVLHPDLEPDEGRRQQKVTLMQELTAAYRKNDLHTLLRLELQWIQKQEGDVARLTEEKLAIYNQVLREQVSGLEWELDELPLHPRYQQIAVADGPFGIRMRTNGPEEARILDGTIETMEAFIARMQTSEAFSTVRAAIREYRDVERARKQAAAAARRAAFAEYGTPF